MNRSLANSNGPGASMVNGQGVSCPVSLIITGVPLNPNHQLLMP